MTIVRNFIMDRSAFPSIHEEILGLLREPQESFYYNFVYLFSVICTIDDVYEYWKDFINDVDWINHNLTPSGLDANDAMWELTNRYIEFHQNNYRRLYFLRKPPPGVEYVVTSLSFITDTTLLVEIDPFVQQDDNEIYAPPSDEILMMKKVEKGERLYGSDNYERSVQPLHYRPY
ncbi:MAG: hypothetical protein IBX57_00110 [Gammaproteobacteria bacterium]|nr:hypothetical protein [Gammaproteobacteria bacterium]